MMSPSVRNLAAVLILSCWGRSVAQAAPPFFRSQVVVDPADTGQNLGTAQSPRIATDGSAWVTVWENSVSPDQDIQILVSRSTDATTWSEPKKISAQRAPYFAPLIATDGNTWVIVWSQSFGGDNARLIASYSRDDGINWSPPATIAEAPSNTYMNGDHAIATDGHGMWIVLGTIQDPVIGNADPYEPDMFMVRSSDSAASWSDIQPLDPTGDNDPPLEDRLVDRHPVLTYDGTTGRWVAAWDVRTASPAPPDSDSVDTDIVFASSTDGLSWSEPQLLFSFFQDSLDSFADRLPAISSRNGRFVISWRRRRFTRYQRYMGTSATGTEWSSPLIKDDVPLALNISAMNPVGDGTRWVGTLDSDGSIISVSRSDDGITWGPNERIAPDPGSTQLHVGNADLAADGHGKWVVVWAGDDTVPGAGDMDLFVTVGVNDPTCGDGRVEGAEQCDGGVCCTSTCAYADSTTVCRTAAGPCDEAETCSGQTPACPDDAHKEFGFICDPARSCTQNAVCDGRSILCPAQLDDPNGTCSDHDPCTDSDTCGHGRCVSGESVCSVEAEDYNVVKTSKGKVTPQPVMVQCGGAGTRAKCVAQVFSDEEAVDQTPIAGAAPTPAVAPIAITQRGKIVVAAGKTVTLRLKLTKQGKKFLAALTGRTMGTVKSTVKHLNGDKKEFPDVRRVIVFLPRF